MCTNNVNVIFALVVVHNENLNMMNKKEQIFVGGKGLIHILPPFHKECRSHFSRSQICKKNQTFWRQFYMTLKWLHYYITG